MIDLFKLCGLPRRFDDAALAAALAALPDDGRGHRDTIEAVLGDPAKRGRYERLHLQCRAIAATLDALERDGATDRHGWRDRLSDFAGAPDCAETARRTRSSTRGGATSTSWRGRDGGPGVAGSR